VTDPAYIDTLPTGESSPWWLNKNCDVVHRRDCRHARHPWLDAAMKTEAQLRRIPSSYGLRLCRVCLPEIEEDR
jgi:hypothetical protein